MSEKLNETLTSENIQTFELGCNQCQVEVQNRKECLVMARKTSNKNEGQKVTIELKISHPDRPLAPPPADYDQHFSWQQYRSVAVRMDWYNLNTYEMVFGKSLDNTDHLLVHLIKGVKYYYVEVFCYDAK